MAENILETRIQLRYGTYSQWMNSDVILMQGEAAICAFPYSNTIVSSDTRPEHTPPAIGIKIGDGSSYFYQLPWVQAVAADVYNWAKDSQKPQYSAQEIIGLQNFVENLITGDTDITIAPRIYELTQGTGANANKYYLRYKENNEESEWVLDTSTYIDLSDLVKLSAWIGQDVNNFSSLGDRTEEHIQFDLGRLKVTDTEQGSSVVTSVSQTNGKVSTTKRQLTFSDISGTITPEHGGTGRTNLTQDQVLVGNGTEAVNFVPIASEIAMNNALVPNYLIKSYVDNATAGLTGAMHFIGEATVVINPNSGIDPRIDGYNFGQAQFGDVILYDSKEYVWDGTWRLLGDEGSYAVKGSIKDTDISADAEIQQSKIAGLADTFDTKVDKVEGKTLTSNDFSDELKDKLSNIQDGAQVNAIEHIFLNGEEASITAVNSLAKSVNLTVQEFDTTSQDKLAGIESNAQVNKIEKVIYDGVELTPNENKILTINSDPHSEHENKIESIKINGKEYSPNQDKQVNITIDQAALNLNVLEGAQVPSVSGAGKDEVEQISKKLQLARIAITGDVQNLLQTADTYITFDCGSSTEVV